MKYSPEKMEQICAYITSGTSLLELCKRADMPSYAELVNWIRTNDDAALKMNEARVVMQHRWVNTLEEIGEREIESRTGAAMAKLHSDNLKWLLEREWADKYGGAKQVDLTLEVNLRTALDNALTRLETIPQPLPRPVIDVPVREGDELIDPMA